jgi:hypothetical protein
MTWQDSKLEKEKLLKGENEGRKGGGERLESRLRLPPSLEHLQKGATRRHSQSCPTL